MPEASTGRSRPSTAFRVVRGAGLGLLLVLVGIPVARAAPERLTLSAGLSSSVPVLGARELGVGLYLTLPVSPELLELEVGVAMVSGVLIGRSGLSAVVRCGLVAPFGRWQPVAGLELEMTRFPPLDMTGSDFIPGSLQALGMQAERLDGIRAGGYAAPLRLTFFDHLVISALELSAATPLSPRFGQVLILRLGVLKVGWTF